MKLDKTMYDKLREEEVKLSEITFNAEESGKFIQIQEWRRGCIQIQVWQRGREQIIINDNLKDKIKKQNKLIYKLRKEIKECKGK